MYPSGTLAYIVKRDKCVQINNLAFLLGKSEFETSALWGLLGLLGVMIAGIWTAQSILKKQVFILFKDWINSDDGKTALSSKISTHLNQPESELNRHKSDPDAHEPMRQKIESSFDERFDKLDSMILTGQSIQTEELNAFKKEALDPVVALSNRVLDLLENQLGGKNVK